MKIDFDPIKDALNVRVHGISLAVSKELLEGFTVEWIDNRSDYGETRIIAIGEIKDSNLSAFTRCAVNFTVPSLSAELVDRR